MKEPVCTALIKFSQREVELMISALDNIIKFEIPYNDSSDWRIPYKKLLDDLKDIRVKMIEKVESSVEKRKPESSVVQGSVCID